MISAFNFSYLVADFWPQLIEFEIIAELVWKIKFWIDTSENPSEILARILLLRQLIKIIGRNNLYQIKVSLSKFKRRDPQSARSGNRQVRVRIGPGFALDLSVFSVDLLSNKLLQIGVGEKYLYHILGMKNIFSMFDADFWRFVSCKWLIKYELNFRVERFNI